MSHNTNVTHTVIASFSIKKGNIIDLYSQSEQHPEPRALTLLVIIVGDA